ncbi:hypothetical protein [Acinetobacter sp. WZC-1]|uniref:hypothetical protein n=1 Tax=Acinetobacter sp. WZC-1 TaxID=3459034 RepID=UPI00403D77F1
MFHKGTVQSYDPSLKSGKIVLNDSEQVLIFLETDFPRSRLAPQLGERIKCLITEQNGEYRANYVVRLDFKNVMEDDENNIVHQTVDTMLGLPQDQQQDPAPNADAAVAQSATDTTATQSGTLQKPDTGSHFSKVFAGVGHPGKSKLRSSYRKIKTRVAYRIYSREKSQLHRRTGSIIPPWLPAGGLSLCIAVYLGLYGYDQYRKYQQEQEVKLQLYMLEQQRRIAEQRRAQGKLPDRILSEKSLDELLGKDRNRAAESH